MTVRELTSAALDDWRDPDTLHLDDVDRRALGQKVVDLIAAEFHAKNPGRDATPICPGCFMVVLFYAAVALELALPRPDLALLADSFIAAWHRFGHMILHRFPVERATAATVAAITGEPA